MVEKESFGKVCKERMTDEILSRLKERPNFFITNYIGLTNAELELLRRSLRKTSSRYFVVKNAILKVVFDKLKLKDLLGLIDGGVGISLSGEDIISTSKALVNFMREHGRFKIKGAYLDGREVSCDRIRELASLPPKDLLLAQVLSGMKSPITGFVNVLGGVLRKFVYCLDAIKNKKPVK